MNLHMNFKDYYPNNDPKTWMSKNGSVKRVRVMQLVDVNVDPNEIFLDPKRDDEEMDQDDEDEDDVENDTEEIKNRTDRSLIFTVRFYVFLYALHLI